MKGDFSRDTFNKSKHYRTVRMQQGRVQLDADWNEQMDIFDLQLRNQFTDLIGEAATPVGEDGFKIVVDEETPDKRLLILKGRYYVAGVVAENEEDSLFTGQPDLPGQTLPDTHGVYILYLDVWQRHISTAEDPELKEVALNGVDTTSRIKLLSQVKSLKLGELGTPVEKNTLADQPLWQLETAQSTGQLAVRLNGDPQLINGFYRIEIHQGGDPDNDEVSFKWSRDNGAIIRRIKQINIEALSIDIEPVTLSQQDQFHIGDWIELSHESWALQGRAGVFVQLTEVNDNQFKILAWPSAITPDDFINGSVRHWNSALRSVVSGSINAETISIASIEGNDVTLDPAVAEIETLFSIDQLVELTNQALIDAGEPGLLARIEAIDTTNNRLTIPGVGSFNPAPDLIRPEDDGLVNSDGFIALENGIEVKFEPGIYHTGDYWTVSSRRLSNSLDWPLNETGDPESQTAFGVQHHYVPLALFTLQEDDSWDIEDYRTLFVPSARNPVASAADEAVIFVDQNENVGIGTASPTAKLDVAGSVRAAGFIIDENENVGIGTTSPAAKLDVVGSVKATTFDGFGIVPIGTIQAWHKDLPNVPALPDGWAECNGQVLNDPDSPLDSQTIPDLNGENRFLMGATISGSSGGSNTMRDHSHTGSTSNNTHSHTIQAAADAGAHTGWLSAHQPGSPPVGNHVSHHDTHSHSVTVGSGSAPDSTDNRPNYYVIIWVMRVK